MENKDLKKKYDKIYSENSQKFFTFYNYNESKTILDLISWIDKKVLEIGCGEGRLATMIKIAGAKSVLAVDYSKEAIGIAKNSFNINGLEFMQNDYKEIKGKYDVVVLQGVLEHFENPFEVLDHIIENLTNENGIVINSSPSFLNLRGHIWMTLALLFDVPMSLSDLNFLCVFDFETFCEARGLFITYKSSDQDWGCGKRLIIDFQKRLRNALRDVNMLNEIKLNKFLDWLKKASKYCNYTDYSGANIIYKISKIKTSD